MRQVFLLLNEYFTCKPELASGDKNLCSTVEKSFLLSCVHSIIQISQFYNLSLQFRIGSRVKTRGLQSCKLFTWLNWCGALRGYLKTR